MRQLFLLIVCAFALSFGLSAQNLSGHWKAISLDAVALPATVQRNFEPYKYTAYELDLPALKATLATAPMEFTAVAKQHPCRVAFPDANGRMETYAIVYTRVMEPALQAQFPDIRTYSGASLTTPGKRIRITTSPEWGLSAMIVREDHGIDYVEPVAQGQFTYFMAYDRHDFPQESRAALPTAAVDINALQSLDEQRPQGRFAPVQPPPVGSRGPLETPVTLKTYRFAAATTGEFSQDNGGTTASVLAKVTTTTNQLNEIYERDLSIRLELIAQESLILFLDPDTDPYTGTEVGGWLNQNSVAMVQKLGSSDKYDIGHVFARYLGGNALGVGTLGSCCTPSKGRGCSAGNTPYGDDFFGVIGQEIGHQWDGYHTWNRCDGLTEPFSDAERCEPGSGSTIMSYAGACSGDNVKGSSDLYYQVCSIVGIRNFVENGDGATCGTNTVTANSRPAITPSSYPASFFIPVRTPFELKGAATDVDGDALTYSWDETDTGPMAPLGSPTGSSPLFRSFPPSSSPVRTFPRIQSIISNSSSLTEVLPTYSRDLTFCFVVRDNAEGGGRALDTVSFKSTDLAGPFQVTVPNNSAVVWQVGEFQTVTWEVANTDGPQVKCKSVNVRLSLDNGLTYPITLAGNVPNVGRCCVLVPNNVSTTARVRVEAADNVFFDISNSGFKIQQPSQPGFSFCPGPLAALACLPGSFSTEISTSGVSGFADATTFSVTGLPAGATATFSPNPIVPGSPTTLTITFAAGQPETTFDAIITAGSATSKLTLTTVSNDFSTFAMVSPLNGTSGVDKSPTVRWAGATDAITYEIEVASSPSFAPGTIVSSGSNITTDSFKVTPFLNEGGVYYWRIRAKNECGPTDWMATAAFVVRVQSCITLVANDVPKLISANSINTAESKITVANGGVISDVNIKKIQGNHAFFKDLEVRLISPAGTDVLLFKDKCGASNGNFNFGMDDSAPAALTCPPPQNGNAYKPTGFLNAINGQNAVGDWILRVKDNVVSSGGQLTGFELELCGDVALSIPIIVKNNLLQVMPGANAAVGNDLLKAEDANNTASQLTFTLVTVPKNGDLRLNFGAVLKVGDQYTQQDIDNGALRFFDAGVSGAFDSFRFTVSDNEGGLATGTFVIQPFPVGTQEPQVGLNFDIAPNPANASVRLSFTEALTADTRVAVFNVAGQRVLAQTLGAGSLTLLLDIAALPDGVYAITVENDQARGVKKIVKQ